MKYLIRCLIVTVYMVLGLSYAGDAAPGVPILLYHRFDPLKAGSMTVTAPVFESHLKYLHENGYKIIPLSELLDMHQGKKITAESRYVVLTADDAHISVYTIARPLLEKYNAHMTLFIYPSAVSNASYAMTWEQLRELETTGRFDFQSHTYWHPNFKKERERLSAAEFERFVRIQLSRSRETIEQKLGVNVDLLAWPFGIFDQGLMDRAAATGYTAAFSIERRPVTNADNPLALPRYLITDDDRNNRFKNIIDLSIISARKVSKTAKTD